MCSIHEHSDRSAREHAAQQQEPIYTELANEYGLDYEPVPADPEKSAARSFLDQTAL